MRHLFKFRNGYFYQTILILVLLCNSLILGQKPELGANPPWQRGNLNAKYQIEVFVDYECPACVEANKKIREIQSKYPNDVLIIFRHYPFTQIHKNSMLAAQAVEAAGMQGKFWKMSDLLFLKQKKWSVSKSAEEIFINYAKKLEMNAEMFKEDLQNKEGNKRINLDIERAKFLNVNAIPSVFINGRFLSFERLPDLEEIILLQEVK